MPSTVYAVFRKRLAHEPVPSERGDHHCEHADAEQAEQAIHDDAERSGSLMADGRFLEQVVALDQIASGAAGDEEAEEEADHEQAVEPPP